MLIFDAIIIGEELYGLYVGLNLLNKNKSVAILEKDGNINNKDDYSSFFIIVHLVLHVRTISYQVFI